jgi:uncharacterized protein YjaG (DUF416 family)
MENVEGKEYTPNLETLKFYLEMGNSDIDRHRTKIVIYERVGKEWDVKWHTAKIEEVEKQIAVIKELIAEQEVVVDNMMEGPEMMPIEADDVQP